MSEIDSEKATDDRGGREQDEGAEAERQERIAKGIRVLREGHGANCSSIGSVVDTLFAGAILGGAIFAAVAAALAREEKVRVVGGSAAPGERSSNGTARSSEEPRR